MNKLAIFIVAFSLSACASAQPIKHIRSQAAKGEFKRLHPCPANGHDHGTCPGYVIDHIVALACGGADDSSNMQWQTKEDAKAKDKWERSGC